MKAAVVLAVFIAGKTSQAFIATPITAAAVAEQATGAVSRSSVGGAGDDNQCGYGWTGVAWRHSNGGMCMATSSELDQSAEYVKAELARVQEEYEAKRKAKMREQTQAAAARGDAAVTPLADLEFIPFLDTEGMLTTLDTTGVKASVYAVYDEAKTLKYIGVSRGIQQTLRLTLARRPTEAYFFKVQNIARPSRSLLEIMKESWIEENGSTPSGNMDEESQALWENPINVLPKFTEEDEAHVAAMREKGREAMGIKKIARRFEDEIMEILEKRGLTERLRFDPKLKGQGLLDLQGAKKMPDTAVPK